MQMIVKVCLLSGCSHFNNEERLKRKRNRISGAPCGGDEIQEAGGGEGEQRGDGDHVKVDSGGGRLGRRRLSFLAIAVVAVVVFRTPLTSMIKLVDRRLEKGGKELGKGGNLCKDQ